MSNYPSPRCFAALSLVCLATLPDLYAQTWNATTPTPGDWQLSTNWTPNTVPNAIGASALLSNDLAAGTLSINLNGAVTLGNLTMGDSVAATNGFFNVFNGTGGSLTFQAASGNATLQKTTAIGSTDTISATTTLNSSLAADIRTGTIRIDGVVVGAGGVIRSGSVSGAVLTAGGTLILSNNANSYSGTTTIEHGSLTAILNGDILVSTNSVLGNSATSLAVGLSTTVAGGNGTSVINFQAGSDTANYRIARGIDFTQSTTSTTRAALNFNANGTGSLNTNTLELSGPLLVGTRATQIVAARSGMTINTTGDISTIGTLGGDNIRWNGFPADPGATVVDGRGSGTIRLSNLNRTYTNSQSLVNGRLVIDGVVGALGSPSPIGTTALSLALGSGGNIVGAGNFAAGAAAARDSSPDTVRSVLLESAGSSYARILAPGVGSTSTAGQTGANALPASYGTTVTVLNGYQIGGLNVSGITTFSGEISPGDVTVGTSPTNIITTAINLALVAEGGGTVEFTGGIGDTPTADTTARVSINQLRNHPNLDGVNNTTNLVGADGVPDPAANQLVGTAKTGTVVLSTAAGTWEGTTEVLGGAFLVNSSVAGNSLTAASGATLGGSGIINAGSGGSILQVNGTLAPGTSPGILTSNKPVSFNVGSTFAAEINGTTVGTQYDQLAANSTLSISSTSVFSLTLGYAPAPGEQFTLINLASGVISGTFAGLAEGGTKTASFAGTPYDFTASYVGGTGNDLVLTLVPEPASTGFLAGVFGLFLRTRRPGVTVAAR